MAIDVTATEDSLSKAEFEALLEAAVDGICVIDRRGRIMQTNTAVTRLFGYEADELDGQNISELMSGADRRDHDQYMDRYVATQKAKIIGVGREVTGRRKDGSVFPLHLSVGEVQPKAGHRSHFVGIMRDLSAQKAAEDEARELQERLTHVGRFSVMGEMAAGLAHEINQPLSAIVTYADAGHRLLQRDGGASAELAEVCEKIAQQAQRAGDIIANLRSFISKREIEKDPLDLNHVLDDVLTLIRADTRAAGIQLVVNTTATLPKMLGDAVQLQQVIVNLTRNAVDAMKEGIRKQDGVIVETFAEGQTVGFSVTDHGHGISPQLAESIFHPFVTTKKEGLGVGLAISRTIVSAHGGKLTYYPNPGGGAVFKVVFPIVRTHE